MSTPEWLRRTRHRLTLGRLPKLPSPGRWIGVDFARDGGGRNARKLLPLLVLALIVSLGIAALRIDLIRIRYAMASAVDEETALLEEQRSLIVRRRQLRDPAELEAQARSRGFRPATQVVLLRDPIISHSRTNTPFLVNDNGILPRVAAGPPNSRSGGDWQ